uniref:Protein kinase domain-containing protein n=1 Tax=Acrobeloides nanus TaxID=290746 RepID=A0A914DGU7_9BILA
MMSKFQTIMQTISSENKNGINTFNVTVIFAGISKGGSLSITNGGNVILDTNNATIIENKNYTFTGVEMKVEYVQGEGYTKGMLMRYEAKFIPYKPPGPSPLTLATKRIETQHFQDCKVAVKDPSSFGYDESEQLFNEIESMKKIGYHEHIISMLSFVSWTKIR